MKKIFTFMSLMILLVCIAGCASRDTADGSAFTQLDSPYRLKQIYMCDLQNGWAVSAENELLITKEGPEVFSAVKKFEDIAPQTDGFLNASFPDSQTAYLAYFSSDGLHLTVDYTHDGGGSWQQTMLNYKEYGNLCDAGSAYLSFADIDNGYLLYCSTPGSGMMTKLLLKTIDGGESFTLVGDLTDEIAGYPQGISFDGNNGYIAVSYHGEDSYLYKTSDGGVTWEDIKILSDKEDIDYIDGYAPVFSGTDSRKGMLVLRAVGDDAITRSFTTKDGGDSWEQAGEVSCESVIGYSYVNDNCLLFIDSSGNLYESSR